MNIAEDLFKTYFDDSNAYLHFKVAHKVVLDSKTFLKNKILIDSIEVFNETGDWQSYDDKPARISFSLGRECISMWWYTLGSITHEHSENLPKDIDKSFTVVERFKAIKTSFSLTNRSLNTHKAEELFKTYFDSATDYLQFRSDHKVRIDRGKQFLDGLEVVQVEQSFDDKPSRVVVYGDRGNTEYSVMWSGRDSAMHRPRENGPAEIIKYKNGRIEQRYYENGKRVRRPTFH